MKVVSPVCRGDHFHFHHPLATAPRRSIVGNPFRHSRAEEALALRTNTRRNMNRVLVGILGLGLIPSMMCLAEESLPDAPSTPPPFVAGSFIYSPPTQKIRFAEYAKQTYSISSVIEASVRGGIDQARNRPSGWPEGAQGFADRFGSAMGQIAVRNTTEYIVGDIFREDLRFVPCARPCSESKFKRALQDTFAARKGVDGHQTFSMARLVGPIAGAAVAKSVWYPGGTGTPETVRQVGLSYAFDLLHNYIREITH